MAQLKSFLKKVILAIILISILITFCAMPSSYAKLDLGEGEFYYAGTQKGQYTVKEGIFSWLLSKIGDIADWILGIITMGFRMVFVGWTALFEKLLTWALESTAGVNASGEVVENNTDLTAITDSTNNVTIEAIVYNHVAALDANPFHVTRSIDELKYSPTGHILQCTNKDCIEAKAPGKKSVDITECCTLDEANKTVTGCTCPESCEGCTAYKEAVENYYDENAKVPMIYQVKRTIANWYYVIRLLAIAAMLVVLIVVGIKMATASLAQDKAVYKNMLVDWLVGIIIIFAMHYIMLFTFYISEQLVSTIEKVATSSYSATMMQLAEKESGKDDKGVEYDNEELEIKIYEAVRTRAYDAKLIDGMIGVVMYMTLVYFAFRYTIVYLKRFFTIIVLTLMAPTLGVGYALQKVLTGKQEAFKNWLSQYILNVFLQVVHALIYAIFISQALILSLESVAGMIVALILMNYALQADKIFRKIFKIQGGFVEEANNAAENLKSTVRDTAIGGKAAIKTLGNTPYTKLAKGIGKAAVAAPFVAIGGIKKGAQSLGRSSSNSDSSGDGSADASFEPTYDGSPRLSEGSLDDGTYDSTYEGSGSSSRRRKNRPELNSAGLPKRSDRELLGIGKKTLKGNLDKAKQAVLNAKTDEERDSAYAKYLNALNEYERYEKLTTPSTAKIVGAKFERIIDIDNIFEFTPPQGGHTGLSGKVRSFFAFARDSYGGIYGHRYRDPKTGKIVNDGTGLYNQLKPSNFLGLTKEDKDLLKKQMGLVGGTFGGMASLFLGMGTLVANPKVGMGLLASGAVLTHKGLGRSSHVSSYKGTYTFNRFGIPTIKNMEKIALKRAKKEHDDLVRQSVRTRAKYRNMKIRGAVTLAGTAAGALAGIGAGAAIVPAALVGAGVSVAAQGAGFVTKRFTARTNIGQGLRDLDQHWAKQEKAQEKEFKTETLNIINAETQARMSVIIDERNEHLDSEETAYVKKLYKSLGYEYDPKTGDLRAIVKSATDEERQQERFENELRRKFKDDEIDDSVVRKHISPSSHLTDVEIALIDKEIDNILISMSDGEVLDMESEAKLDEATRQLTARLALAGVIKDNQRAEIVFKAGKRELRTTLKEKAEIANAKLEIAAKELKGIGEEDQQFIKQAVGEISREKGISDFTQIKAEEVLEKVNEKRKNSRVKVKENPAESPAENPENPIENPESPEGQERPEETQQNSRTERNRKHFSDRQERRKPLTEQERQEFKTKITAYLLGLETAKKVTHTKGFSKKQQAIAQVSSSVVRRKQKLRQVLEMSFDSEELDPTESLIEQVNRIKRTGGVIKTSGKEVEIASDESSKVLEMLFLRKQLEEINNLAVEEVGIKKGSYKFQKATKAKAEARVDYFRDDLEIKKYAQENPEIFADANFELRTDHYTEDQIRERKRIRELEKGLHVKRREVDRATRDLTMSGPIVDLSETKRKLLKHE